jgi:hypothetical protein
MTVSYAIRERRFVSCFLILVSRALDGRAGQRAG